MYKSDHELEQGWVRTPRTYPLDTRLTVVNVVDGRTLNRQLIF